MNHCSDAPDYPDRPVLDFVSYSKSTVFQEIFVNINGDSVRSEDSIRITLYYEDGDGDLNLNNADFNISYWDGRNDQKVSDVRLPEFPEEGAANGISGELSFIIRGFCCIYESMQTPCTPSISGESDEIFYKIILRDRAGNVSDTLQTPVLQINCN